MRTYTLDGKKLPLKGDAKESCETCRFWKYVGSDGGECRRYAPRSVHWGQTQNEEGDRGDDTVVWPVVDIADWCGEYEEAAK